MSITMRRMTILVLAAVMISGVFFAYPADLTYAAAKRPAKVKGLSLKLTGSRIKVSWKKAKNAKKYQVYVRTGAGKWKMKKTLKKLSFTAAGVNGRTYSFKVRGVNGKKKGAFSQVKAIAIPEDRPEEPADDIDGEIIILEEPDIQSADDGTEATFTVRAEGKNLNYQWFVSMAEDNTAGKRIDGATDSTYTVTASPLTKDTFYYCVISNNSCSCRTKAAGLDVVLGNHVYITEQPEPTTVYEGEEAVFTVNAMGTGECIYQWYRNDTDSNTGGVKLDGQTDKRMTMDTRLYDDDTYYYCRVRDSISIMSSECVKLDVEISPSRKKLVKDINELVEKDGVQSTETVSVDGSDFYVIAIEDEKALLLSKQPSGQSDCLVAGTEMWGDDDQPANTRLGLNNSYLPSMTTLKCMAIEVTNTTHSYTETDDYYETKEKVFVLTEADVTGSYSRIKGETRLMDFSFDKTEDHIGKALPLEIAQLRDEEGNLIMWWVRSPESTGHFWWDETRLYTNPAYVSYTDDGSIAMTRYQMSWPPYIRPALWVDLSIE